MSTPGTFARIKEWLERVDEAVHFDEKDHIWARLVALEKEVADLRNALNNARPDQATTADTPTEEETV